MCKAALGVARWIIIALVVSVLSFGSEARAVDELRITGSTTFAPLVTAVGDAFMKQNPNVKILFTESNAAESIRSLVDGEVEVGCSARILSATEAKRASAKGLNLDCRTIALDSIIPIVHPSNTTRSLGLAHLNSIFTGQSTNWKEFDDGPNCKISVITREEGSAMIEFWKEKIMQGNSVMAGATTLRSNQEIVKAVSNDPCAIGYTSFSRLNSQVKALPLNGIDTAAVPYEKHPLARKLIMCTNSQASGIAQQFMGFIGSPQGKSVIQKAGYTTD